MPDSLNPASIMAAASRRKSSRVGTLAGDRRRTAVHEAGHYVIGRHVGLRHVAARIWHEDYGLSDMKLYGGFAGPACRREWAKLSVKRHMMIGCAGMAAEWAWEERFDDGANGWIGDHLMDPMAMSASDWNGAYTEPGEPCSKLIRVAEPAAGLFSAHGGPLWPELLRVSRVLIREGFIASSEMAREQASSVAPKRLAFQYGDVLVMSDGTFQHAKNGLVTVDMANAAMDAMRAKTKAEPLSIGAGGSGMDVQPLPAPQWFPEL